MPDACYVCDSPELVDGADLRNPTCAGHVSARDHVVSNQTAPAPYGGTYSLAICQCGWSVRRLRGGKAVADEITRLVRAHWIAVAEAAQ
ncbi:MULTISPECIES: hypothetical protein [unclassified Sphingopyxis]|uniref:hypothetical protein n=1 Tax=unclassified Sphingopyxis TaxID=2614943 RepID=UPI0007312C40|nr:MULTISPECIES: hypothetical protein [unclassified Sphingopyxis]KTE24430.1 hypothetical protein ATE61_13570 [Sphingopyxis sp. H057]KTE50958.1 hypothetical protein ATE69_17270 [Sphingopyxis sp. H071]KTE52101.1 hypothetical protein ATE64_11875 [Sphingopyxis sp. H073]KTE60566.1 hypothetical protein ATE66_08270 [Sphingopyxis sp. H107]KTE63845.1 hypothetical protein ATE65_13665 [Sphingopyxis sp. H100]